MIGLTMSNIPRKEKTASKRTALPARKQARPQRQGTKQTKQKQTDPLGKNQHEPGAKLDYGKPRVALVLGDFAKALQRVTEVGTFGAEKYTPHGWLEVPDGNERYQDAMMRHWLAYKCGEYTDPDSGLDHLAHFAWNALAVLQLTEDLKNGPRNPE